MSIIVPAYNEEKRIGRMLDAYLPYFNARYDGRYEMIVVINGSSDASAAIVSGYAERGQPVKCIVDEGRIGKGGALIKGFHLASGEFIGFVDADGATPPEAFDDLLQSIGDGDAIIASRWARGAKISPRQPLNRRIASRVFNTLTNLLFGLHLTDTQCGAKLVRGKCLKSILDHLGVTQWAFDVDLLFQLRRAGCSIREIPTTWHDVEGSKIEIGRASTEMLLALTRLRLIYSPFRGLVRLYKPAWMPPALRHDRELTP
ncbi:MAG: glycosyltransferase family 2 protein [Verrucomicrobia bacterium]|nr:glycosyltransferase family 2 protein [Verrucomicrobiota bacterium]